MKPSSSTSSPVVRTALLCGVATGLCCLAWVLFLYASNNNPYGAKRTLSSFFPPIAAIVSQVLLRRHYPDGPGLWKSVGVGLLTAVFSAVVAAAGLYLFARLTGPELIAQHLVEARQLLESTKALYLKQSNGLQQYEATWRGLAHTPQGFAQDEFAKKLLLGLVLSIPGGVFLRK